MPNLLCHDLLPSFLNILRKRFLQITSNPEYQVLFSRKLDALHFQLVFYLFDNLVSEFYFGALLPFLHNNFPVELSSAPMASPLRLLALDTEERQRYSQALTPLLANHVSNRTDHVTLADQWGSFLCHSGPHAANI